MSRYVNIPNGLDDDWVFVGYIALVTAGALSMCYLDEKRASKPTLSATVYPLCFPDESIPWNHLQRFEFFGGKAAPPAENADEIHLPVSTRLHAYVGYLMLTILGIVREAVWTVSLKKSSSHHREAWNSIWWKEFFTQHMYRRIEECWGRPIASAPTSQVEVCLRDRPAGFFSQLFNGFAPLRLTGEKRLCINMASYNYLGFGGVDRDCTPACAEAIRSWGISFGTQRSDYTRGSSTLHLELEKEVALFLKKEDAIVMGMGFATNSTLIPAAVVGGGKGVLILSDELNHKSIVEGCRLSGATIRSVSHSDMKGLESVLATETRKNVWKKIFIFVEGVYSMEGGYCRLREIIRLKLKYKCYVWLDEAHSIGGVGLSGRGVTELFHVATEHIDVMMGTFTKSFGSAGGYIASSKALIDQVRQNSIGFLEASSMSAVCAQQALSAFKAMQSPRGIRKIKQLRANCDYFRTQLVNLGCRVVGDLHSPVVCAMLVHPEKISHFSTECLKRNLAVVVVGYPATPVLLSRVRFCLSASHSQRDLDNVIAILAEVVDKVGVKYAQGELPLDVEALFHQEAALSIDLTTAGDVIDYWDPLPLAVPQQTSGQLLLPPAPHKGRIDAARHDPLNLLSSPPASVIDSAIAKLEEVGCGTCGPRGFYGTTTDHLELEKRIASFLGTEAAIVYSHHVSTTSSVIPAFIKQHDLVLLRADPIKSCSFIASGLRLSRAANVMAWTSCEDLSNLLLNASTATATAVHSRVWIICEGGSSHLDLKRVVELKLAHGAYLLLEDTFAIGATGPTGRGTVERCAVRISDVDIVIGSLEHAFGAVGGFCAGRTDVIEHQRLYGDGYCFSASAPACLTVAATRAIDFLESESGKIRLESLQNNLELFVNEIEKKTPQIQLLSSRCCYAQILKLPPNFTADKVYAKLASVRTQPVKVSPIGLNLLKQCQPQAALFEEYLDRLLRVNLHSEMCSKDVVLIADELAHILAQRATVI